MKKEEVIEWAIRNKLFWKANIISPGPHPDWTWVGPGDRHTLGRFINTNLQQTVTYTDVFMARDEPGAHYGQEFKGVKLDPYRVCDVYNVGGGPREHAIKKLLRGTDKGHTELEVIGEVRKCLNRWEEMINESV